MTHNPFLKHLRGRWRLSQDEVADLLGITQSSVSRYELGEEYPPLTTALGLQVLFGMSPRRVFNVLYGEVEDRIMDAAASLEEAIRHRSDHASSQKRHLLEGMAARAGTHDAV